ncbi:MAG TPA: hypothetical protein VLE48_03790, partial [Terriglobales bacterium]|nr:hypothetical protein [Terriglobales bacterium]
MLNVLLAKVIGTRNERELKRLQPAVERINALEPEIERLSDADLRAKTEEFRERIRKHLEPYTAGIERARELGPDEVDRAQDELRRAEREALDDLLPEAFAVVREAGRRTLNMRHFDVQLIGGMVLHQGKIAEMKTGEGKTLVATLAVFLNSLTGRGVHVVTVNDYLARRDAEWMRPIYEALGITVGVVVPGMPPAAKREAYACDVVYATNNELGFDYLRDNMAFSIEQKV